MKHTAAAVANTDLKLQIYSIVWDQPSKAQSFWWNPQALTVASFWTASSDAPSDARPISWENWAKLGSAKRGTWPRSSWQVSLKKETKQEISWFVFVAKWESSTTEQIQYLPLNFITQKTEKCHPFLWKHQSTSYQPYIKCIKSDFQRQVPKIKVWAPHLQGNWILN